jgi:hypothetical protein
MKLVRIFANRFLLLLKSAQYIVFGRHHGRFQSQHIVFFFFANSVRTNFAQRRDQTIAQIFRIHGYFSDFAQSNDGIFVAIAVKRQSAAARNLPRAMGREQHKGKSIWDALNAILNRNAGHMLDPVGK